MVCSGIACLSGVLYYKYKPATSEEKAEILIEKCDGINGPQAQYAAYQPLPLSQASYANDCQLVLHLIQRGANINQRDGCYEDLNPLLWACVNGSTEAATILLKNGANIEIDDKLGKTPLIIATIQGHASLMKLLLENRANVNNCDDERMTALAWAAKKGRLDSVQLLLQKGAVIDTVDINGRTPFLWACWESEWDIANLLMSKGANINKHDNFGFTPLIAACANGNRDFAKKLILAGADVSTISKEYSQEINSLLNKHGVK